MGLIPLKRCVICGEQVQNKYRLIHLHTHRLGLEDLKNNTLFVVTLSRHRKSIKESKDERCPYCNSLPSPIIFNSNTYIGVHFHKSIPDKIITTLSFLVKCTNCKKLFRITRQYKEENLLKGEARKGEYWRKQGD